ncbi:MAG: nucleotide-binding protein [Promethearchaeota archaeon]
MIFTSRKNKKGFKIGFAGKGGVGKTLLASTIARLAARTGLFERVLAIDNDPSLNLGMALGIPEDKIGPPISDMKDLIKERTGVIPGSSLVFKMNPKVEDIPDKYTVEGPDGVKLLVLGTVIDPGSGCLCSANALVRELLYHLIVKRDELVILDFEAGVESSLGRATSKGLDIFFVVIEPTQKSINVGKKMVKLALKLGIKHVFIIINKVRNEKQENLVKKTLQEDGIEVFGTVPYTDSIMESELEGVALLDYSEDDEVVSAINSLLNKIISDFYKQQ